MALSRLERFLADRIDCDGCGRKLRIEFATMFGKRRLCPSCVRKAN